MKILLLGPPGSGKGTQSAMLANHLDIPHISTGDIFRKNINLNTDLGKIVKEIIKKGELVPDEIVIEAVKSYLKNEQLFEFGFIMDGFPRTVYQAEKFQEFCGLDLVILVDVPDEVITQRILSRRICPNCGKGYNIITNPPKIKDRCDICGQVLITRADDNIDSVKNRLLIYHNETAPLIDYYKKKGILKEVNGNKEPEEVFREIKEQLVFG